MLSQIIKHFIVRELTHALTSTDDQLRVLFSGPPKKILNELFFALSIEGDMLEIELSESKIELPVFLIDPRAKDPSDLISAKCTHNHLVKVRTSDCRAYIALVGQGDATNLSLETTATRLGLINYDHASFEDWREEPLIAHIAREVLSRYFPYDSNDFEDYIVYLDYSLKTTWEHNDSNLDRREVWRTIENLCNANVGKNPRDTFMAIIGSPNGATAGQFTNAKIVEKVSALFAEQGIRETRQILKRELADDLEEEISEFCAHIEKGTRFPSGFQANPLQIYSPIKDISDGSIEIPQWWYKLDSSVWEDCLSLSTTTKKVGLSVDCPKALKTVKGFTTTTQSETEFDLCLTTPGASGEVIISRAIGMKDFTEQASVEISDTPTKWIDNEIPDHKSFIRYRFESHLLNKPVVKKVIVLDKFEPGLFVHSWRAEKVTPFSWNPKAKAPNGSKRPCYECEVKLSSMGSHKFDLFYSNDLILDSTINGHETNSEYDNSITPRIISSGDNHSTCFLTTDEECSYEFRAKHSSCESEHWYIIRILADDKNPIGVSSIFERLISENCIPKHSTNLSIEIPPSLLLDYEIWALQDGDSHFPVIMGHGLDKHWEKPIWSNFHVISEHEIMWDPRPLHSSYSPPSQLLKCRDEIRRALFESAKDQGESIQTVRLSELMLESTFVALLKRYLNEYVSWLSSDYDNAIWMDVISLHAKEADNDCLEAIPFALLLSPLHPLRISWQCNAQVILQDAINEDLPCPGASILEPSAFPDCLALSCRNSTSGFDKKGFFALRSNSDYWSILWNSDKASDISKANELGIFGNAFGLSIEGITSGFSPQQVKRSLNEMTLQSSAQSSFRVAISSDTVGLNQCNTGIDLWSSENLGVDNDEWSAAGPRSLHIHDFRSTEQHPEPSILASLTKKSGNNVRWFARDSGDDVEECDLSIIAHLGTVNPAFSFHSIRSQVDPTCSSRLSVRKQTSAEMKMFLAQSRVGSFQNISADIDLDSALSIAMAKIESACVENDLFDSLSFAPNTTILQKALNTATYCAVSSSSVDASCFFQTSDQSYLWDYELPNYSRDANESSGFYLLAKESDNMKLALRSSIKQLGEHLHTTEEFTLNDHLASELLKEVSHRGIPTLKKLTSGGSASLGEVGMLVALRVLQTEFQKDPAFSGLLPISQNNIINLVIPADIFQSRFDNLRKRLEKNLSEERPDLILISIRLGNIKPVSIKITPLEVKTRTSILSNEQRQQALNQSTSFSNFLQLLETKSHDLSLWGIVWRNMVGSWLDYGFRVYGQFDEAIETKSWTETHQSVIGELMSGELDVQIDKTGRLICIDQSPNGEVLSLSGNSHKDTIILNHADALSLLFDGQKDLIEKLRIHLGSWDVEPEEAKEKEDPITPLNSPTEVIKKPNVDDDVNSQNKESISSDVSHSSSKQSHSEGIKFIIGEALDSIKEKNVEYFPSNTDLTHMNMGIVGDLGTGKTQLLKSLIYQMGRYPEQNRGIKPSILIMDYKRDYSKNDFVQKTGAKVIQPQNLPLNMFNTEDCTQENNKWLERSRFFTDLLTKIYGGLGAPQKNRIKNAVKKSFADQETGDPTIYDVFESYKELLGDAKIDSPYAIMEDIVDGTYFESDPSKIVSFKDFLGGVVVLDLSALGQDDQTKNLLVAIFLNLFYEYMLKTEKKEFIEGEEQLRFIDSFLLVDEADNIMQYEFPVLKKLLLQGREFGIGVVLASQYLSHFKTTNENYMEPLLTWFIHRVPNITNHQLDNIGLSVQGHSGTIPARISNLGLHECLCKTLGVNGEFIKGKPFYELD